MDGSLSRKLYRPPWTGRINAEDSIVHHVAGGAYVWRTNGPISQELDSAIGLVHQFTTDDESLNEWSKATNGLRNQIRILTKAIQHRIAFTRLNSIIALLLHSPPARVSADRTTQLGQYLISSPSSVELTVSSPS
uniref:Uncharacterized protein F14C21.35 n=1 Tax=Arabidopsis thaliana TaxID=3702 RepID=Q9C7L6_ARATH|nr:unknown protein [Arabidopsis thaliana]